MTMLQALRRHPLPMRTTFGHSLVLTYALPPAVLAPLLPPGPALDTYEGHGFVAIGIVSTRHLRPSPLPPALGIDAVLTGYRIFTTFPTPAGKSMRGLYILRSDTDRPALAAAGNLLTRYRYHLGRVGLTVDGDRLTATVDSRDGGADLTVTADLASRPAPLPPGSPFADPAAARRFAGPLPYTFDAEDDGIVVVKAHRSTWVPEPVAVQVSRCTFLERGPFAGTAPVLAHAFHVAGIDYGWHRGVRRAVDGSAR
ncbi:DUF2071 domain-containing protein [Dactylosporangium sp. NPDC005555]|uniref:DUF2071 domain-containing protein n=1 Tax=Dactylosporangium sp. NPDC005555 TaxID=3154889 RepID=UPI0033A35CF2